MKKTTIILMLTLLVFTSCSSSCTIEINDEGILVLNEVAYSPLEGSCRLTDYGKSKRLGTVAEGDVYFISEGVLLLEDSDGGTYYVTENYIGIDRDFEECSEFLFVPKADLDKNGKVGKKYVERASRLTDTEAVDFAFYVFYGREPEELGYQKGVYVGELMALSDINLPLLSSYSVYKWSSADYSVEIDGIHYMLEEKWSKKIGIID